MLTHTLHEALQAPRSPIKVLVVGAGGNGSKLTVGMKNLHGALQALEDEALDRADTAFAAAWARLDRALRAIEDTR